MSDEPCNECPTRPLLVVDKTPTAITMLAVFAGIVLWAFATLNATTDERSRRNESTIKDVQHKLDAGFAKTTDLLIEISGKLGAKE